MDLLDLRFPKYNGNETENEHIVYTYLGSILRERGYLIKVKKTNFSNIDENIVSYKGRGRGSCDAYIFSENESDKLIALIELESTGNLCAENSGINQVRSYAHGLSLRFKEGGYRTKYQAIYLIAYDGQKLWVSQYNLTTGDELTIIGKDEDGIDVTDLEKDKLFSLFTKREKTELVEKNLIKRTKNILRGDKSLQGNKAFMLTVLASIYGNTMKDEFEAALNKLKSLANSGKRDSIAILDKWKLISVKISYENNSEINSKIAQLYTQVAINLFIIAQDKQLDLYGYIYEELAEKNNKKEDGEYYTPRAHIESILNSIYSRYLAKKWKLDSDKENSIDRILSKRITDPFCGSGGFLYTFLKLLKDKYDLDECELNEISKLSIWGLDKNDITSAYFNLFLIGDGEATLKSIATTINWQNSWKYKIESSSNVENVKVVKIESDFELEESIQKFRLTFLSMLENLIDMEMVKSKFSLMKTYIKVSTITEFIEKYESSKGKMSEKYLLFDELAKKEYKEDNKPVLRLIYETLKSVSTNSTNMIEYADFINVLGIVDFLPTNVPYGNLDDNRFKGDIGDRLESQALIECIDLLRPSSFGVNDDNGGYVSNEDGGIATVIIPSGIFEREEVKVREYLFKRCKILSIVKLPLNTFSPYATIQTYVLTFRKKAVFEFDSDIQNQDVFMYIVDNDGKSNSDKRYITNNINTERTKIFKSNGEYVSAVYEYIHNEIDVNLEQYPEGYLSKLERAWIYGNIANTVNLNWNQVRYNQNWDGEKWGKELGRKWIYTKLEKKTTQKQVEKKNKKRILSVIRNIINQNEEFENEDIENQKKIIIEVLRREYLEEIKIIKKNKDSVFVIDNKDKKINNIILKEYFKECFKDSNSESIDISNGLQEIIQNIIDEEIDLFPAKIRKDVEYVMNDFDRIVIDINQEVKLYKYIEYEEYDLVIDNYLIPKLQITKEEIITNTTRLESMDSDKNYYILSKQKKIDDVLKEIDEIVNTENRKYTEIIYLEDIMKKMVERGGRLTEADIYLEYGDVPVYSSTISGPYGYYKYYNYEVDDDAIIYAIEGNAGYISFPKKGKIFLTDVAGIIYLKKEFIEKYSKMAIAIYLQHLFVKHRHNNGQQPKFLVKRNINMQIDLEVLEKISSIFK